MSEPDKGAEPSEVLKEMYGVHKMEGDLPAVRGPIVDASGKCRVTGAILYISHERTCNN